MKKSIAFMLILLSSIAFAQCNANVAGLQTVSTNHGQWAYFHFNVTNENIVNDYASINMLCPFEQCEISPSSFSLDNMETENVEIRIFVPADALQGAYNLPVNFESNFITETCVISKNLTLNVVGTPQIVPDKTFIVGSADSYLAGRRGESVDFEINTANWIDQKTMVDISIISNPFPSGSVELNPISFDLGGYESRTVHLKVNIRGDTPGGDYEFVVKVKAWQQVKETSEIVVLRLHVGAPAAKLTIVEQPSGCVATVHDNETTFRLKIRNDGEERNNFAVNVSGLDADISPSVFELKPGEFTWLNIGFTAGREIANGTHNIILEAKSGEFRLFVRNYCVDLNVLRDVSIDGENTFSVSENGIEKAIFIVSNNGTGEEDLSVRFEGAGIVGVAEPRTFSLNTGEARAVSVSFIGLIPGEHTIKVIAESPFTTAEKEVAVSVLQAGVSEIDTLAIGVGDVIDVVRGMVNEVTIPVTNVGVTSAKTVTVTISGVPKEMSDTSISADLFPSQQYNFRLSLNVSNYSDASYNGKIKVFSDAGYSEKSVTVRVNAVLKKINYAYVTKEATNERILIIVSVKNEGNIALEGIKPEIKNLPEGWITRAEPAIVDTLAVNETKNVTLYIFPVTESPAQQAFLSLAGLDETFQGVGNGEISLPEIKLEVPTKGIDYVLIGKVALMVIMVIAIAAMIKIEKK